MFESAARTSTSSSSAGARATSRNNLEKKIALYRSFETPVVCGGTLFEVVYAQRPARRVQGLARASIGFSHVEISDGTIEIPRERKLELIADFARDFIVLSEVGSKDSDGRVRAVPVGRSGSSEELDAGAWKVITEAREGGTAGHLPHRPARCAPAWSRRSRTRSRSRTSIFEAPTKSSQAWFVKHFGPDVNLGNIPPDEVIPLETLRLGLRGDTLKEVLLGDAQPAHSLPDFEAMSAEDVLRWAHAEFGDRLCLTCSWQKQSSVLVHHESRNTDDCFCHEHVRQRRSPSSVYAQRRTSSHGHHIEI